MYKYLLILLNIIAFNANSSTLYGITGSGTVQGYATDSGNLIIDFGPNSGNQGLTSGDGFVFSNGLRNDVTGSLHKYDAVNGTYISSFGDESGTRDLAYADGIVYGISGTGEILSYDAMTEDFLGGFGSNSGGQALAAGDGYIYTDLGLQSGGIHKYDTVTKNLVLSFGESNSGTGLAYDNGIVYSNKNNTLLNYNADTGDFIGGFEVGSGGTHITAGDGKVYVAAHRNGVTGSVHEYNATSFEYIKNFGDVASSRQITLLSTVPIPAAVWLFSSGLLGLLAVTRGKT